MNRRQLIKTALVALPSSAVLGRSAASLAQDATLTVLHEVLDEIRQTNAWTTGTVDRYYEIRKGAFVGTYFVQLLDNAGSERQRPTPAEMVADLFPHDYVDWTRANGHMLSEFVHERFDGLVNATSELYERRGADYSNMLAALGILADGEVAKFVTSGAMVATLVGLAAVSRGRDVEGIPSSIDTYDITGSLETVAIAVYPC